MSDADDRIAAAKAAIAEREHLVQVKALLADDIATEDKRVQQLAKELRFEQADVQRLTTGVMGFIQSIIDDNAIEKEKREVVEAQARLREAQGSLDMLRKQAADVDARIQQLVPANLDRDLAAARADKERDLLSGGGATGAQLEDIAIRIESIDIELIPLAEAVTAGGDAFQACANILSALDVAATQYMGAITDRAKALAGECQAKLVVFQRAIDNVGSASFDAPLGLDPSDTRFADEWVKALFTKRTPQERLKSARDSMVARIERVQAVLGPLRTRRDEIAARRLKLVEERQKLING